MSLLKPFDPEQMDFPDMGNLIGMFDRDVPVRLPDSDREFRPLLVTGAGEAPEHSQQKWEPVLRFGNATNNKMKRWIAGQMARDANRRPDAVVCIDPGGRYAEAFAQRIDRTEAKRVIWFDLDAPFGNGRTAGRVIPLNPCDPFGHHDEVDFLAFRDRLLVETGPLPPVAAEVLGFALTAFTRNRCFEADRAFTLPALLTFLADAGYRRYIVSGLHPALLGRMPAKDGFEQAFQILATRLRPVFADPVWRATLGVETAPAFLDKLPSASIIIVTGETLTSNDLPAVLWRHAFFAHLRHILMRGDIVQTLHLYGFGSNALDDPGTQRILARSASARTTVTLARDAYGDSDHRPRLFFDQEIAFEVDAARMLVPVR